MISSFLERVRHVAKILLVEDDNTLSEQVDSWLTHEQHVIEVVSEGKEAIDRLRLYTYDLVVLDWGLPDITGIKVLKDYRNEGGKTPVLMLTGKGEIEEKMTGLDTGADDYLTKPFHFKELSARVRALLRRPSDVKSINLKAGNLELDTVSHKVTIDGAEIKLLPKEFQLLQLLLSHPDQVFSADALLERVWSSESDTTVDSVYTYIKTLRKKTAACNAPNLIRTVPNVGYKYEP